MNCKQNFFYDFVLIMRFLHIFVVAKAYDCFCVHILDVFCVFFWTQNFATSVIRKKDTAQDIPDGVSAPTTHGVVDALYTSGAGCLCCLFFLMGSEGLEFGIS